MKTKNLPLLVLIASAMIQVLCFFLYLFLCSCNAMIQDIKASKHFLIETKNTTSHGKDYDSDSQFTFQNFGGISDSLGNGGCTCKFPFYHDGKKWRPKDDGTLCQIALKKWRSKERLDAPSICKCPVNVL